MFNIQDLYLNGAQCLDLIANCCHADDYIRQAGDTPTFFRTREPITVYKKLRGGTYYESVNVARLVLPPDTLIYAGELVHEVGYNLYAGRGNEGSLLSGYLDDNHRNIYKGMGEQAQSVQNWRWFIRHTNTRKMRASRAFVDAIVNVELNGLRLDFLEDGDIVVDARVKGHVAEAYSNYDADFKYVVGKTVRPLRPFSESEDQCESGIHFFFNLVDAINYEL